MTPLTLGQLARATGGDLAGDPSLEVDRVAYDSRATLPGPRPLFAALRGAADDGHRYIAAMAARGVKAFLVEAWPCGVELPAGGGYVRVADTLAALQALAAGWRGRFQCPVVGVTGSNGKTIVKEWAAQCLAPDLAVTRSPRSFNSQLGVPLSVLEMTAETQTAIFEAGISRPGEMQRLEPVIRPTIGLITNLGDAHQENFADRGQKLAEKCQLFRRAGTIIAPSGDAEIERYLREQFPDKELFFWGRRPGDALQVTTAARGNATEIEAAYQGESFRATLPFGDSVSAWNACATLALLLRLGMPAAAAADRLARLQAVDMRLEMRAGRGNCTIINDSYNSDLESLESAFDFLSRQRQHNSKIVVVSDIYQSSLPPEALYPKVARLAAAHHPSQFIGVGPALSRHAGLFAPGSLFFADTDALLRHFAATPPRDAVVLLKGSRPFRFERVGDLLQERQHRTVMSVNLDAMAANLRHFRSRLRPETRIIVMLKAFGYGNGSFELANLLESSHVDRFAVAFTDEAWHLRRNGVTAPIMVMNPAVESLGDLISGGFEPEVYSHALLDALERRLAEAGIEGYPVHIKANTGMNRSGFAPADAPQLARRLAASPRVRAVSLFSHLAAADAPEHDAFTRGQFDAFDRFAADLAAALPYPFLRHILNSAGAERFPERQYDAVRLGIGLYGISCVGDPGIAPVASLRTRVMQVNRVAAGQTVGYGRRGAVERPSEIATIPIGYADGFRRSLGNGRGHVLVAGALAPTLGNVCMDTCMVDVTGLGVAAGDEVEIFGPGLPLQDLADAMGTIPYEVLTGISSRVKRVYYRE